MKSHRTKQPTHLLGGRTVVEFLWCSSLTFFSIASPKLSWKKSSRRLGNGAEILNLGERETSCWPQVSSHDEFDWHGWGRCHQRMAHRELFHTWMKVQKEAGTVRIPRMFQWSVNQRQLAVGEKLAPNNQLMRQQNSISTVFNGHSSNVFHLRRYFTPKNLAQARVCWARGASWAQLKNAASNEIFDLRAINNSFLGSLLQKYSLWDFWGILYRKKNVSGAISFRWKHSHKSFSFSYVVKTFKTI